MVSAGAVVGTLLVAARYEPVIMPHTRVGGIDVGGMTPEAAAKRLRVWWEFERVREVSLKLSDPSVKPMVTKVTRLGYKLDDKASVAQLPIQDLVDAAKAAVGQGDDAPKHYQPVFARVGVADLEAIRDYVEDNVGGVKPAKAVWDGTQVVREPERSGATLDEEAFAAEVPKVLAGANEIELPTREADKKVPDEELAKITDLVSEFSTKFAASNRNRSDNLRIASGLIDGKVLMPGEEFSFNGYVGRRTAQQGYKVAGIYLNGRHEEGLAGGICQVSTTLYNAVLFANLKITKRQNHSMPVPYVPLGRDATVSYPGLDLKFVNSYDVPIAISSSYTPGKLTFRILGVKDPSLSVKIVSDSSKSWAKSEKVVTDASLPAGTRKVVDKGSAPRAINTYRVVYVNGEEVKREPLGRSYYRGGPRLIAVGAAKKSNFAGESSPTPPLSSAPPPPRA